MSFSLFTDSLGWLLAWIPPDAVTISVIGVCVYLYFRGEKVRDIAPALMVSAGIIGTFFGTFIALNHLKTGGTGGGLDHRAMVESIPGVLDGMRTAFVTTLIGLGFAFVKKWRTRLAQKEEYKPLPIEEETVNLLKKINDGISGESDNSLSSKISVLQAEYRDSTATLKQAISGESDSSIASQLMKLRNENKAGVDRLDNRFDGLADAIRNSLVKNFEALMNELRETLVNQVAEQLKQTNELLRNQLSEMLTRIEDALIKQFGETFKQFNEATQAIKKWQEDHRVQVEQLTEAFATTATGIVQIRENCESIPAAMDKLRELLGELDERIKAFAEMKKAAEESFPVIKANLDAIGEDLKSAATGFDGLEKTIRDTNQKLGEAAQQHMEGLSAQINLVSENVGVVAGNMMQKSEEVLTVHQQAGLEMIDAMKNTSNTLLTESQKSADNLRTEMEGLTGKLQSAVQDAAEKSVGQITDHLNAVASQHFKRMEEETNKLNGLITSTAQVWGRLHGGHCQKVCGSD